MGAENRKPESEDLDRWLDLALRERANAEPRAGLEDRVLARLATEPPRTIIWWPAVAAVAVLLVVVITFVMIHPLVASALQSSSKPHERAIYAGDSQ